MTSTLLYDSSIFSMNLAMCAIGMHLKVKCRSYIRAPILNNIPSAQYLTYISTFSLP